MVDSFMWNILGSFLHLEFGPQTHILCTLIDAYFSKVKGSKSLARDKKGEGLLVGINLGESTIFSLK